MNLRADEVIDLDVMIGERARGSFRSLLLIEKEGDPYEKREAFPSSSSLPTTPRRLTKEKRLNQVCSPPRYAWRRIYFSNQQLHLYRHETEPL